MTKRNQVNVTLFALLMILVVAADSMLAAFSTELRSEGFEMSAGKNAIRQAAE